MIYVDDKPVPSDADESTFDGSIAGNADSVLLCQQNDSTVTPYISVKRQIYLNSGNTIKLMIGRADGTNDTVSMKVMSANLRVKTIPMV